MLYWNPRKPHQRTPLPNMKDRAKLPSAIIIKMKQPPQRNARKLPVLLGDIPLAEINNVPNQQQEIKGQ